MINPENIILDLTRSQNDRIQAAFKLGLRGWTSDLELLVKALFTDPSPIVRHECAFALGETCAKSIVPALIQSMKTDSNIFVVHEAALALGTLGDLRAEEPLKELLNSHEADIRESAEIALQRLFSDDDFMNDEKEEG